MASSHNLSIPNKQRASFDKWAQAVKAGLIPGESASARIMELIRQDTEKFAHKLRKAGVKTPPAQ